MNPVEIIWTAGVLAVAIVFGTQENPIRSIHRVDICVMREDKSTITMNVWSDEVKRYLYHYPGTACGKCGAEFECKLDKPGY